MLPAITCNVASVLSVNEPKSMQAVGYPITENRPIIRFEPKPFGDEDPDVVIATTKRALNEI